MRKKQQIFGEEKWLHFVVLWKSWKRNKKKFTTTAGEEKKQGKVINLAKVFSMVHYPLSVFVFSFIRIKVFLMWTLNEKENFILNIKFTKKHSRKVHCWSENGFWKWKTSNLLFKARKTVVLVRLLKYVDGKGNLNVKQEIDFFDKIGKRLFFWWAAEKKFCTLKQAKNREEGR